jgi:hypothetical protein
MLGPKINHRVAMNLRFAMMNENSIFKSGTEPTEQDLQKLCALCVPVIQILFAFGLARLGIRAT